MADFFSSPVRNMILAEVRPLYDQRVSESIRLEYKRAIPADDGDFMYEMAKALSSFARTPSATLSLRQRVRAFS